MAKRKILPAAESQAIRQELADAVEADRLLRVSVAAFLYEVLKADICLESSITLVVNLIREFDAETVVGWVRISADRTYLRERKAMQYLCGIARNVRDKEGYPDGQG